MSFGSIEIPTITRAQDFTAIKHNEDNKAFIDQTNIGQQAQRTSTQRATSVNNSDNAEWHNKQPDAREKGSNEYSGDGGRKRQKKEGTEQVVIKGRGGFDIKI